MSSAPFRHIELAPSFFGGRPSTANLTLIACLPDVGCSFRPTVERRRSAELAQTPSLTRYFLQRNCRCSPAPKALSPPATA
jgi:hypothetical protein